MRAGETGYWRALLQQSLHEPNSVRLSYQIAVQYGQLHDLDNAFLWLEKAYKGRTTDILSLKVDPDLDPLRADSGLQKLVRGVDLP